MRKIESSKVLTLIKNTKINNDRFNYVKKKSVSINKFENTMGIDIF